MNRHANRTLTTIYCTGLLSSAALAFGSDVAGRGNTIDPAHDPFYWSNRLPACPVDPATSDASGNGRGPRGDCVTCTDMENEQNCGIPTDTVNGGCNSSPPVFGSLQCCEEFCGTGATNGTIRDTDWWMFEIQQTSIVTLTVTADFPLQIGFGDLNNGCPIAELIAGVFGDECSPAAITQTLEPGTYVAFVAPQFLPVVTCGAQYTGTLHCAVDCPCPGDFDADRLVSLSDLALILSGFGGQPSNRCMDFNDDCVIGLEDLSTFLPTFGTSCP